MHKEGDFEIKVDSLSKIEGHADLEVKVKNRKVEYAHLKISESKRFFTQAVRGKSALNVAQVVSRICGTCSIAHLLCCIEAVENASGIIPSDQTMVLRNLTMDGLMIRDHAMHLYLFCLPDVMNADSILEIAENDRELVEKAFEVKSAGNELSKIIAGRAVHPPYPIVGGFSRVPPNDEARKIAHLLKDARDHALEFADIFRDAMPLFERKTHFVALKNQNYEFIGGELCSSEGYCISRKNFLEHLNRVVKPYSQATGFEFEGREYMVGALARMNLNREALHPDTKRDLSSMLAYFPSNNIYMNNLAQAIEIVNCIDHAIEKLETSDFKKEQISLPKLAAGEGVGVIEAPRGTLYYNLKINNGGLIDYINLVIPTAQNMVNMEKDMEKIVQDNLDVGRSKERIRVELERIIRAYDPCMSCATHFLKVRWIEEGSRKRT
ncbi:MAG: nickel-dependent hydrogenase large subunit [Candidatus Anstonellales archaeon]